MSRWFRHYVGMMRDEKLVRVAAKTGQPVERVIWVWGAVLESASEIGDGGRYDFDADEAAYFLRCQGADVGCILTGLEASGRIVQGVVARWSDRQFDSDDSRERQRRYRERRHTYASNGKGDGHVTHSDGERPSPNGTMTLQDTDTELEDTNVSLSETSSDASVPEPKKSRKRGSYPANFLAFWAEYPTDALMSKKAAAVVWSRMTEDQRVDAMRSLPAFRAYCQSKPDYRPVHANRYLSQERFNGFNEVAAKASGKVFVAKDTPEWEAWQRVKRTASVMSQEFRREGWWFPSRLPEQHGIAA